MESQLNLGIVILGGVTLHSDPLYSGLACDCEGLMLVIHTWAHVKEVAVPSQTWRIRKLHWGSPMKHPTANLHPQPQECLAQSWTCGTTEFNPAPFLTH